MPSTLVPPPSLPAADASHLRLAADLALATEAMGNLPIAAVLVLDGAVVAPGTNRTLHPCRHPGRHAEIEALAALPEALLPRLADLTCYTTLEPCLMCFGALVLHGVGRVVYGARDPLGGAVALAAHLPPHVAAKASAMRWEGPAWPELCAPLWERAAARYWTTSTPESGARR